MVNQKPALNWLIIAILLIGLWFRVRDQAHVEFWTDEAVSVQHVRALGWSGLTESLVHNEGMPWLYFSFLQAWHNLGENEIMLRLPSILLGELSIALMAILGFRLLGKFGGVIAATLLSASTMAVMLSQWARPYSLALSLTILLWLLSLSLKHHPNNWKYWALLTGSSILAIYTLYMLGFLTLGLTLYQVYQRRRLGLLSAFLPILAFGAVVSVAFLPWIPSVLYQGSWAPRALWWVSPPHPRLILETLDQFLAGLEIRNWPKALVLGSIPLLLIFIAVGGYWAYKQRRFSLYFFALILPVALIWVLSYRSPIYAARHVFFAIPGCLLLLTEGLALLRSPAVRLSTSLGIVGLCWMAQLSPIIDSGTITPWSQIASSISHQASSGDLVVLSPPFQRPALALKYDGPPLDMKGVDVYDEYLRQPDRVLGLTIPLERIQAWTANHESFWLVEDTRWPNDWSGWTEFVVASKQEFPGATVYLYIRNPVDD